MEITVYVVWTLEDIDNVDIFINEKKAQRAYEEYGEFGCWAQQTFRLNASLEEEDEE